MASNGYDILLLEAQDRLSSNDLEGTGRGGQVELWDLGQVLQVDWFDLLADVVPKCTKSKCDPQRATFWYATNG